MAPRNAERSEAARVLRGVAAQYDVDRVPDNASFARVSNMKAAVLQAEGLTAEHRQEAERAWSAYMATWPAPGPGEAEREEAQPAQAAPEQKEKEWKFHAAQLTYNATVGEWAATDKAVLKALFERFVAFLCATASFIGAAGASATMEQSTKKGEHVHIHSYFHLAKEFRKKGADALSCFVFEGIRPHVEPNTARGNAFKGAVNMGHFYVVVEKVGSLFQWTDYPPWEAYGVEAWWLDNWLKQGKLTRKTYLSLAARVTVGFQRRLADVRAAERYEQEVAVEEQVALETSAAGSLLRNVKTFPEVDQFLELFRLSHNLLRRPMLAIIGATNLGYQVSFGAQAQEPGGLG